MVGDFFKGYSQVDCSFNFNINPIQMGLIGAAHGCGEGGGGKKVLLSKICHLAQLYLT